MASSPRCHAEQLLAKCRLYNLIDSTGNPKADAVFLTVTEEAFRGMLADELRWLAEYFEERAKREGPKTEEPPSDGPAASLTKPPSPRRW
jgi:hypothetical protein